MKLIVFGATGRTGPHLVHQALERGHQVTAVARDPSRISLEHEALTTVKADVTSVEALRPLLYGQDAVLSALGARRNREAGIVAQASRAVVSAMKESGTRRILVVSAAPVGPSPKGEKFAIRFLLTPLVRLAFAPQYADLAEMEEELAASGLDWTVVRPPRLLDGPGTGTYRSALGSNVPNGTSITRADLARALLDMLTNDATVGQVVGVAQ